LTSSLANIQFTDEQAYVTLTNTSDPTSFGHELAHWFLQQNIVLIQQGLAPQSLIDDMDIVMRHLDGTRLDQLSQPYADGRLHNGKVDIPHEKWARLFETYLTEGKAPVEELEGPFATYRKWFAGVYGGVKEVARKLGVELDPEITAVFDRLYAIENEVNGQEVAGGPVFSDPQAMGFKDESDPRWIRYKKLYFQATEQAKQQLSKRFIAGIRRLHKEQRKQARADIKKRVEEDVRDDGAWQALKWLKRGEQPFGETRIAVGNTIALSFKAVTEIFGTEAPQIIEELKATPGQGGGRNLVAREGHEGHDPDDLAEVFGFNSGRALVEALLAVQPVEAQIRQQINEEFANSSDFDIEQIQEEAIQATANLPREQILQAELRALRELANEESTERAVEAVDSTGAPSAAVSDDRLAQARSALTAAVESGDEQEIANQTAAVQQAEVASRADLEGRKRQRASVRRIAEIEAQLSSRTLRRKARLLVGAREVRQLRRDRAAWQSTMKSQGKLARKLVAARDFLGAALALEKQLMAHHAVVEANRLIEDTDKAHKYASKFLKARELDKLRAAAFNGADQIEQLLRRIDLRKTRSQVEHGTLSKQERKLVRLADEQSREAGMQSLSKWAQEAEGNGEVVSFDPIVMAESYRKHWRKMEAGEFLGFVDAIRNIERISRGEILSRKEKSKLTIAEGGRRIAERIRQIAPNKKKSKYVNPIGVEKAKDLIETLDAMLLRPEELIDFLGGDDIENNVLRELLWDPINTASFDELELSAEYTAKIKDLVEKLDNSRLQRWEVIPELNGARLRHHELIAMALNRGNESNWKKLVEGYANEEAYGWSEEGIQAALNRITDEEWVFVQEVWDTLEGLKDPIWKTHFEVTGKTPREIEANEFITPTGRVMQGGYYPVVYDADKDSSGRVRKLNDKADLNGMFGFSHLSPETEHGYTEGRSEGFSRPMLLDLRVLPNHIEKVIHDITHRKAIIDVYRIVQNKEVRKAIKETWGQPYVDALTEWVQAQARTSPSYQGMSRKWGRLADGMRSNMTMVGIGYRISTALLQFGGIMPVFGNVGVKHTSLALANFMVAPHKVIARAQKRSRQMKFRMGNNDRDIRREVAKLTGKTGPITTVKLFAFHMVGWTDLMVSSVAHEAAFLRGMEEHGNSKRAVREADRAVTRTQGSGLRKDLTNVQARTGLFKFFTMFYSYLSTLYAAQRRMYRVGTGKQAQEDVGGMPLRKADPIKAIALWSTTILLQTLMSELIQGRVPDEEEREKDKLWMLKLIGTTSIAPIPGAREVTSIAKGFGRGPIARVVEPAMRLFEDLGDAYEGEPDVEVMIRNSLLLTGYIGGLPIAQLEIWVDNFWLDQRLENPRDLIWRKPKERR